MNESMEERSPKRKKTKFMLKEELMQLEKEELADEILKERMHIAQLRDIINKFKSETDKKYAQKTNRKIDYSKYHYRRVFLKLMYFGWDYQGYVTQEHTTSTIEHHLFEALTKSCLIEAREKSSYNRCGRTDKGVSAFSQVISLTIRSNHPPEDQLKPEAISSELPYIYMLNRLLPKDIRVVAWMPLPDDKPEYSARFDCKRRLYKYYFPRADLNIPAMRDACVHLVGSHDFRNLCKMDVGNGVVEYTREIFTANIVPFNGIETDDPTAMYYLRIEANAYLWHQIRCIMGILVLVGEGREQPSIVRDLLNIEDIPRKPQYNLAIDIPLNLFEASYEIEESSNWIHTTHALNLVISDLQKQWAIQNIKSTMMKDCLHSLEAMYASHCAKEKGDGKGETDDKIINHAKVLLHGVRANVYTPLLERNTCLSLQEKIDCVKRRNPEKLSQKKKKME